MNIHILTDEKANTGGIWTSIELINSMLTTIGHTVTIGTQPVPSDLIWIHEFSDISQLKRIIYDANKTGIKIWMHIHDYRHICITGRKSFSHPQTDCHNSLSLKCFYKHSTLNCGKGRNPITLIKKYLKNKKMISVINSVDLVTVYSEYIRQELRINSIQRKNIKKIGPYFKVYNNLKKSKSNELTILWIGRFVKEKGILDFLEILNELENEKVNYKATIIGQGELDQEIKLSLSKNNLNEKVSILSWINPLELENFYKDHRILIFNPVWPEPLGMVGLEAISAGTHVITNGNGGSIEWTKMYPAQTTIAKSKMEILNCIKDIQGKSIETDIPECFDNQLNDLKNLISTKIKSN